MGEVFHHAIVLHFAKSNEVYRAIFIGGGNDFADAFQFVAEPCHAPMPLTVGEIFEVVFSFVMQRVESVLDVVGEDGERFLPPHAEREEQKQAKQESGQNSFNL